MIEACSKVCIHIVYLHPNLAGPMLEPVGNKELATATTTSARRDELTTSVWHANQMI